jgi:hypothetical protein
MRLFKTIWMLGMKIDTILEVRKNPDENPKVSPYEQFKKYKNDPDVYVSYTIDDVMGMNSSNRSKRDQSKKTVPTSISAFPLSELWDTLFIKPGDTIWRPHGSGGRYAWIIKKNKERFIDDVNDYTEEEFISDVKKSRKLILFYRKIIRHDPEAAKMIPFAKLWKITELTAKELDSENYTIKWNALLRKLGFSGFKVNDKNIINTGFNTQAIFLYKSAFTVIERVDTWKGNQRGEPRDIEKVQPNTIINDKKLHKHVERYIQKMEWDKVDIPSDVLSKLEKIIATTPDRAFMYANNYTKMREGNYMVSDVILKGIATDTSLAKMFADTLKMYKNPIPKIIRDAADKEMQHQWEDKNRKWEPEYDT